MKHHAETTKTVKDIIDWLTSNPITMDFNFGIKDAIVIEANIGDIVETYRREIIKEFTAVIEEKNPQQ